MIRCLETRDAPHGLLCTLKWSEGLVLWSYIKGPMSSSEKHDYDTQCQKLKQLSPEVSLTSQGCDWAQQGAIGSYEGTLNGIWGPVRPFKSNHSTSLISFDARDSQPLVLTLLHWYLPRLLK